MSSLSHFNQYIALDHAVLEYYNQYICYLGADISNKLSRPFYVGQPSMESIKSIGERKVWVI